MPYRVMKEIQNPYVYLCELDSMTGALIDNIVKPDLSKGHCIGTDPSGKFVHAVFLGLDRVFNYTIEDGKFKAGVYNSETGAILEIQS